jgi:hypothetical protein
MALNKYRRTNFQEQKEVNDILEYDLVKNNWDLFELNRETTFYTIPQSFLQRPDLISIKLYGNQIYWWIIAKVNQIDDWWNDVNPGDVIQVPNIRDIEDFYLRLRARRRS